VWAHSAAEQMGNVQLFFTKLTGCCLLDAGINFDQASLASSLLNGKPNPFIFLKFRVSKFELLGMTNLHADVSPGTDRCGVAAWMYGVNSLQVEVHYFRTNGRYVSLPDAWHPFSCPDEFTVTAPLNERD
jgi:hypothetical protein